MGELKVEKFIVRTARKLQVGEKLKVGKETFIVVKTENLMGHYRSELVNVSLEWYEL